MPAPTIRRRIGALEGVLIEHPVVEFAPLTPAEIDNIERRVRLREPITRMEIQRLENPRPILQGSVIITCNKGHLCVKRYEGIDLNDI